MFIRQILALFKRSGYEVFGHGLGVKSFFSASPELS